MVGRRWDSVCGADDLHTSVPGVDGLPNVEKEERMTFQLTLYHYGSQRDKKGVLIPDISTIEARSGTEAVRFKDAVLLQREVNIKEHARHVSGWSKSETKQRRKNVLHRISWLHANVEEVRDNYVLSMSRTL